MALSYEFAALMLLPVFTPSNACFPDYLPARSTAYGPVYGRPRNEQRAAWGLTSLAFPIQHRRRAHPRTRSDLIPRNDKMEVSRELLRLVAHASCSFAEFR